MKNLFPLYFLVFSLSCFSQVNLKGRVLDAINHKPVGYASVFLNNSSIGTQTDDDGNFSLKNVKAGKYDLIVSFIGYESYKEQITVNDQDLVLQNILLIAKIIHLRLVTIKPQDNDDRERYLAWFRAEFIGSGPWANNCKILNTEILDFDYGDDTKTLHVSAPDFIEIENSSLGYRIKYLLKDFKLVQQTGTTQILYEGSALFEEMKGSISEQQRWRKRRLADYEGSPMQFFRALTVPQLANKFPQFLYDGFWVMRFTSFTNPERPSDSLINAKISYFKKSKDLYHTDSLLKWKKIAGSPKTLQSLYKDNLSIGAFVKPTDQKGIYAIGFSRPIYSLFINYQKSWLKHIKDGKLTLSSQSINNLSSPENTENTLVQFNNPFAFFDENGQVINLTSLTFSGVWARRRIADLLPVDYVPDTKK